MILFDNNATSPIFPFILEEIYILLKTYPFLNPSSIHSAGKVAKKIMDHARETIASSLNARCHDIYFTSGATEANNMVLSCMKFEAVFTIATEHESILLPALNSRAYLIETDNFGLINLAQLEEKIEKLQTGNFLVSVSYINNESGVIQSISQISQIVKQHGGILHVDCSQFIGKRKFDFAKEDIDVITFSGHKFHAGPGSGAAIFQSKFDIKPLIFGGGQQNFKRAGTENIPAVFALANAVKHVNEDSYLAKYINKTSVFQETIENTVLMYGGEAFAKEKPRVSNTSLISMPNINHFIQLMEFDINDICVSIGSACSSGRTEISHVLKACGIPESDARNYIRVSTSALNEDFEIEKFIDIWKKLAMRGK